MNARSRTNRFFPAFIALAVAVGCAPAPPPVETSAAAPILELMPRAPTVTFDAGPVYVDDQPQIEHDFVVRNDSDRTVTLKKVRCSCTCASSEYPDGELLPGRSATLHIKANLLGRDGPQRFSCTLADEKGSERSYEILLIARQRFGFVPPEVRFGECDPGAT